MAPPAPPSPPPPPPQAAPAPVPAGFAPAPTAARTGPTLRFTPATLGGIAVAVSAFLPWLSFLGVSFNAFEDGVPISGLFSFETTSDSPPLGFLVLAVALGITLASVQGWARTVQRAFAIGAIVVGAAWATQVMRALNDQQQAGQFLDVIGFGVFVCIGGGVVALIGATKQR